MGNELNFTPIVAWTFCYMLTEFPTIEFEIPNIRIYINSLLVMLPPDDSLSVMIWLIDFITLVPLESRTF